MRLNIRTLNNHHIPFGTNEQVVVLGVPKLRHFRVCVHFSSPVQIYRKSYCKTPSIGVGGGDGVSKMLFTLSFLCDRQGGVR